MSMGVKSEEATASSFYLSLGHVSYRLCFRTISPVARSGKDDTSEALEDPFARRSIIFQAALR